jgi:hypothetical protein
LAFFGVLAVKPLVSAREFERRHTQVTEAIR